MQISPGLFSNITNFEQMSSRYDESAMIVRRTLWDYLFRDGSHRFLKLFRCSSPDSSREFMRQLATEQPTAIPPHYRDFLPSRLETLGVLLEMGGSNFATEYADRHLFGRTLDFAPLLIEGRRNSGRKLSIPVVLQDLRRRSEGVSGMICLELQDYWPGLIPSEEMFAIDIDSSFFAALSELVLYVDDKIAESPEASGVLWMLQLENCPPAYNHIIGRSLSAAFRIALGQLLDG